MFHGKLLCLLGDKCTFNLCSMEYFVDICSAHLIPGILSLDIALLIFHLDSYTGVMMSPTSIVSGLSAHFSHYSFVKLRPPTSGACKFIILCLCDELLPSLVSSGRLYLFTSLFSIL